jgi:hypothetical protein
MDKKLLQDILKLANSFEKLALPAGNRPSSKFIEDEIHNSAQHIARIVAGSSHTFDQVVDDFSNSLKHAHGIIWVKDDIGELFASYIAAPKPKQEVNKEPMIEQVVELKS